MSEPGESRHGWNYRRRALGVLLGLGPAGMPLASLWAGPVTAPSAARLFSHVSYYGLGLVMFGALITLLNGSLSLRPSLYRLLYGSTDGMRNISGIGGLGTFAVLLGCLLAFGDRAAAYLGLIVLALDTGGLPWLLIATWHDRSMWDE